MVHTHQESDEFLAEANSLLHCIVIMPEQQETVAARTAMRQKQHHIGQIRQHLWLVKRLTSECNSNTDICAVVTVVS